MNKSPEERLLEAIFGSKASTENDKKEENERRSNLIKLKKDILKEYANKEEEPSPLTSYLSYCYNNIVFYNNECVFTTVYFASRIFHVLGSREKLAFSLALAMFRKFARESEDATDENDFSVLYYKKTRKTHYKGDFKISFEKYIETAFDMYVETSCCGDRMYNIIFDDALETAKTIVSDAKFVEDYYNLEDSADCFYDLKKYGIMESKSGASNVLWLLERTMNSYFKRAIKYIGQKAPFPIVFHEKRRTLLSLLLIATYNRLNFTYNDFDVAYNALAYRLERLFNRYTKFASHWSNETDLMLCNDLLEIASDPFGFDEQIDEQGTDDIPSFTKPYYIFEKLTSSQKDNED